MSPKNACHIHVGLDKNTQQKYQKRSFNCVVLNGQYKEQNTLANLGTSELMFTNFKNAYFPALVYYLFIYFFAVTARSQVVNGVFGQQVSGWLWSSFHETCPIHTNLWSIFVVSLYILTSQKHYLILSFTKPFTKLWPTWFPGSSPSHLTLEAE